VTWTQSHPHHLRSAANESRHFYTRSSRAQKLRQLGFLLVSANNPPALPVDVTLTRIAKADLDDDNLAYAFKAIRDGVADAFGVNDRDPRISWSYSQERARTCSIRIAIAVRT
jgi:hypothetical protein